MRCTVTIPLFRVHMPRRTKVTQPAQRIRESQLPMSPCFNRMSVGGKKCKFYFDSISSAGSTAFDRVAVCMSLPLGVLCTVYLSSALPSCRSITNRLRDSARKKKKRERFLVAGSTINFVSRDVWRSYAAFSTRVTCC